MRKIDELANEKYNGDTKAALKDLFDSGVNMGEYQKELTKDELKFLFNYCLDYTAKKYYGSRENFDKQTLKEVELDSFGITEEELKNTKINPYKAEIAKNFLKLLLVEGGIVSLGFACSYLGVDSTALGAIGSCLTAFFSYGVAQNIMNYFKFRKLKKDYGSETLNNSVDETLDEMDKGMSK